MNTLTVEQVRLRVNQYEVRAMSESILTAFIAEIVNDAALAQPGEVPAPDFGFPGQGGIKYEPQPIRVDFINTEIWREQIRKEAFDQFWDIAACQYGIESGKMDAQELLRRVAESTSKEAFEEAAVCVETQTVGGNKAPGSASRKLLADAIRALAATRTQGSGPRK